MGGFGAASSESARGWMQHRRVSHPAHIGSGRGWRVGRWVGLPTVRRGGEGQRLARVDGRVRGCVLWVGRPHNNRVGKSVSPSLCQPPTAELKQEQQPRT